MKRSLVLALLLVSSLYISGCSGSSSSGNSTTNADGSCTDSTISDLRDMFVSAESAKTSYSSGEARALKFDDAAKKCDDFIRIHPHAACTLSVNGEDIKLDPAKINNYCSDLHKTARETRSASAAAAGTVSSGTPGDSDYRRGRVVTDETVVSEIAPEKFKLEILDFAALNKIGTSNSVNVISNGKIVSINDVRDITSYCLLTATGHPFQAGEVLEAWDIRASTRDGNSTVSIMLRSNKSNDVLNLGCSNLDNRRVTLRDIRKNLGSLTEVQIQ